MRWIVTKPAYAQIRDGQTPDVPNDNFDTGKPDPPGVYFMNDDVHAQLVEELAKTNFKGMSPALRAELTQFYSDPNAPYATKRKPKEWAKLQAALHMLKAAPASAGRSANATRIRRHAVRAGGISWRVSATSASAPDSLPASMNFVFPLNRINCAASAPRA